MKVRAKFYCNKVEAHGTGGERSVELLPVYSQNPNHENKAFWDATPSGKIELYINAADDGGGPRPAAEAFEPGQEYYIDISPAPPTDAD